MAVMMILGLIVCFENIMLQSPGMMIFFETMIGSMFFPLLFILIIGFFAGLFCGLGLLSGKNKNEDFDEVDF